MFCCLLLSPIVSGGVWPKLPGQTPPCFLPFVGRLGSGLRTPPRRSDRVRSTGWCQFSTIIPAGFCPMMSYGSRKRGYNQGGCVRRGWPSSPACNVEPVTNTSSSSCANNGDGRRRKCSARHHPSRLYFLHLATRTVYNSVDLYAAKPDIRPESLFCLPHLHSTPPLGEFPS